MAYMNDLVLQATEEGYPEPQGFFSDWLEGDYSVLPEVGEEKVFELLTQNGQCCFHGVYADDGDLLKWKLWDRDTNAFASVPVEREVRVLIRPWASPEEHWPHPNFRPDTLLTGALNWFEQHLAETSLSTDYRHASGWHIRKELGTFGVGKGDLDGLILHWASPLCCDAVEVLISPSLEGRGASVVVKQFGTDGNLLMEYGYFGIGNDNGLPYLRKDYSVFLPGTDFKVLTRQKVISSASSVASLGYTEFSVPSFEGRKALDYRKGSGGVVHCILSDKIRKLGE